MVTLLLLCVTSPAQSFVEPELKALLGVDDAGRLPVTIVLKSQADVLLPKANAKACSGEENRRATVVKQLKKHSAASQESLLSFLRSSEKQGAVSNISNLWVANAICCEATADIINHIASRNDVASIALDKDVAMACNAVVEDVAQSVVEARAGLTPHIMQVRAPQVWEQGYTGKNVVVAILDSGINDEHTDLKDHLWQGYADTDGDGNADDPVHGWNFSVKDVKGNSNIKDDYGHGTHCAGIICGDGTSGNIVGIAPDATLMAIKTIDRAGGGSPAKMMRGVQFAIENGADIISISSGFKSNQIGTADKEALRRTFESALSAGVIAFVAAGNDGEADGDAMYVDVPASCPPPYLHPDQQSNGGGLSAVVCVGAVNNEDKYATFSSPGPATWQDTSYGDYPLGNDENHIGLLRPDICAPGDYIFSLKHDDNDKYKIMSGTSQATPCAAGIAALMLEKNSTLTPSDVCRIMETTALKLSEKKNNFTGSGRVDALNAVNAVAASAGEPFLKVTSYSPEQIANGVTPELHIVVTNEGKGVCSPNAVLSLFSNDSCVTIAESGLPLGTLASGESVEVAYPLNISPETANGHTVYITAVATDGEYSWSRELVFRVDASARIIGRVNSPLAVAPGNDIALKVDVVNEGNVSTTCETPLTLAISSRYVTMLKDEASIGIIAPGETQTVEFVFNVSEDAPDSTSLQFDLYAVPNGYAKADDCVYGFELHYDRYGYLDNGFEGWTTFDASDNARKHPWWHSSMYVKHRMESPGSNSSGKGHLVSEAYCAASMLESSIPIDNYLVSPKVKATANSKFSVKARVHSASFYDEHFGIAVSESGNSNASSFKTIKEWVIDRSYGTDWQEFGVDLSQYEGKEIYVAVRHFFTQKEWNDSDNGYYLYALHIDDAMFSDVIDMSEMFKENNYSYFSVGVDYSVNTGIDASAGEAVASIVLDGTSICVGGAAAGSVVGVYDICGRNLLNYCVSDGATVSIDASLLEKGVYVVKMMSARGAYAKKILLQ